MSKAQPTKSPPSSSIFAKSRSRSFSVKVFESEKKVKEKGAGGSFHSCFPLCISPALLHIYGNPECSIQLRLTCHFQGLQVCQAGQWAVTDGVDHGTLGGGKLRVLRAGFPPASTYKPCSIITTAQGHPTIASGFPRPCMNPIAVPLKTAPLSPSPRPWGRTKHRASARFIHAQDARLLEAHSRDRRT